MICSEKVGDSVGVGASVGSTDGAIRVGGDVCTTEGDCDEDIVGVFESAAFGENVGKCVGNGDG